MSAHFEGAPAWYITAARTALGHIPEAFVLHSGHEGRVSVGLTIQTGRSLHDHRPRKSPACEQWDALSELVRVDLTAAGFTDITLTLGGLNATAPTPDTPPTVVEIIRHPELLAVGVYTAHIVGHPHLVATIDGGFNHGATNGSAGYTLTGRNDQTISRGWPTPFAAARDYAERCGFGPNIEAREADA